MTEANHPVLAKLRSMVEQLRDDAEAVNPHIEPELALFVAEAFDAYIRAHDEGKPTTLDASFGLKRGRGAPPKPASDEELDIVNRAIFLLAKGATWEDAAAEADPRQVMEESTLRKKVNRRRSEAARQMGRRLADRMNRKDAEKKVGP